MIPMDIKIILIFFLLAACRSFSEDDRGSVSFLSLTPAAKPTASLTQEAATAAVIGRRAGARRG